MGNNLAKNNTIHKSYCKTAHCKELNHYTGEDTSILPVTLQKKIIEYVWEGTNINKKTSLLSFGLVCWRWFHINSPLVDENFTMYDDNCEKHHLTKYVKHLASPYCLWKNVYSIKCDIFVDKQCSRFRRHMETISGDPLAINILKDVKIIKIDTYIQFFDNVIGALTLMKWKDDLVIDVDFPLLNYIPSMTQLSKIISQLPYQFQFKMRYHISSYQKEKGFLLDSNQVPKNMSFSDISLVDFQENDAKELINKFHELHFKDVKMVQIHFFPDQDYMFYLKLKEVIQVHLCIQDIQGEYSINSFSNYLNQVPNLSIFLLSVFNFNNESKKLIELLPSKCTKLCITFTEHSCQSVVRVPSNIDTLVMKRLHPTEMNLPDIDHCWIDFESYDNITTLRIVDIPLSNFNFTKIMNDSPLTTLEIFDVKHNYSDIFLCKTIKSLTISEKNWDNPLKQFILDLEDISNLPSLKVFNVKIGKDSKKPNFPKQSDRFQVQEFTDPNGISNLTLNK